MTALRKNVDVAIKALALTFNQPMQCCHKVGPDDKKNILDKPNSSLRYILSIEMARITVCNFTVWDFCGAGIIFGYLKTWQ